MKRISEYKKCYGLRNKATGYLVLYYWASSQKHKAIFASKEAAIDAAENCDFDVEIVEFE